MKIKRFGHHLKGKPHVIWNQITCEHHMPNHMWTSHVNITCVQITCEHHMRANHMWTSHVYITYGITFYNRSNHMWTPHVNIMYGIIYIITCEHHMWTSQADKLINHFKFTRFVMFATNDLWKDLHVHSHDPQ